MSRNKDSKYKIDERTEKFYEIEIQELFNAMLSIQNSRIQIGIFFATVSLGSMSIAVTTQKPILFFVAAFFTLLFIWLDMRSKSVLAVFSYRARIMQKRYAPKDNKTFLNLINFGIYETQLRDIDEIFKDENNGDEIQISDPKLRNFIFPILGIVTQVLIGLYFWLIIGWKMI
jgi:hypothetical protein